MKDEIPDQIKDSLKKWKSQSSMLQFLYIFLGAISIIAPLIVGGFTDVLGSLLTRIVSFCGAIAVGLIAGFRLSRHANSMRRAYIELRSAIVLYEACNDRTLANLANEYVKISKSIGSIAGPQAHEIARGEED